MGRVTVHGPAVQDLGGAMDDAMRDLEVMVADDVSAAWHENLNASLRTQTPYYVPNITRTRRAAAEVVTDRGVVYGPWLEGVGSRNRTTPFKGYFAARRAVRTVEAMVPERVARVVRAHLGGA